MSRRSLPLLRPPSPRLAAPRPPPAGQAGEWRLVPAIWAQAGEKLRCGNLARGGLPGWGQRVPGKWQSLPHHAARLGQTDTRFSFCFSPLPPASLPSAGLTWRRGAGRRGRGSRGLRGGSRACSGAGSRAAATAAARSAPRPPLHQSLRPASGVGLATGVSAPRDSTPLCRPSPSAPLSVSFLHTSSTFLRTPGTLPVEAPCPDLALHLF